ncbi:rCG38909, partial [Rattus norvegicus]
GRQALRLGLAVPEWLKTQSLAVNSFLGTLTWSSIK